MQKYLVCNQHTGEIVLDNVDFNTAEKFCFKAASDNNFGLCRIWVRAGWNKKEEYFYDCGPVTYVIIETSTNN